MLGLAQASLRVVPQPNLRKLKEKILQIPPLRGAQGGVSSRHWSEVRGKLRGVIVWKK
jgi:hypothetical protein